MPAPTDLGFYTLKRRKISILGQFFWNFSGFGKKVPTWPQSNASTHRPKVWHSKERKLFWLFSPKTNFYTFWDSDFPQISLTDHLLKLKMYHFQVLRAQIYPKMPQMVLFWPHFDPNLDPRRHLDPFWPTHIGSKPDFPQISLFDHLLKLKMYHFQVLRAQIYPKTPQMVLFWPKFGPIWTQISTHVAIWTHLDPPRLGSNPRSKPGPH